MKYLPRHYSPWESLSPNSTPNGPPVHTPTFNKPSLYTRRTLEPASVSRPTQKPPTWPPTPGCTCTTRRPSGSAPWWLGGGAPGSRHRRLYRLLFLQSPERRQRNERCETEEEKPTREHHER